MTFFLRNTKEPPNLDMKIGAIFRKKYVSPISMSLLGQMAN